MTADAVSGGLPLSCVLLGALLVGSCVVRLVALSASGTTVKSITADTVIGWMLLFCATIGGILVLFC